MVGIFQRSGLSTTNYDSILISWNDLDLKEGVSFGAQEIHYCNAGEEREQIIAKHNWRILDYGIKEGCPEEGQ